jgi:phytanoyl-CoA hydroxylase
MTKPAHGGTPLGWHQDGGRFWGVDRAPTLQIWTALDDAPVEAGCLEALPGSHLHGLATPEGGLVPASLLAHARADERAVAYPVKAGESILIHNHVWHRSGVNRTPNPRRGLSVCLMSALTRCLRRKRAPRQFVRLFEAAGLALPDRATELA